MESSRGGEMADAHALGACSRKGVKVQVLSSAPKISQQIKSFCIVKLFQLLSI